MSISYVHDGALQTFRVSVNMGHPASLRFNRGSYIGWFNHTHPSASQLGEQCGITLFLFFFHERFSYNMQLSVWQRGRSFPARVLYTVGVDAHIMARVKAPILPHKRGGICNAHLHAPTINQHTYRRQHANH